MFLLFEEYAERAVLFCIIMNKNYVKSYIVLFLLCACISCVKLNKITKSENEYKPEDNITLNNSEFILNSTINPLTKSPQLDLDGAGHFENGDVNRVFLQDQTNKYIKSFDYTYGNKYYWYNISLQEDIKSCYVSAVYPSVVASNYERFVWNITENAEADILLAKAVLVSVSSSKPINLSFYHAMHKLAVNLRSSDNSVSQSELSTALIKCKNVKNSAILNLLTGEVIGVEGNKVNIDKTGANVDFIIPSQELSDISVEIQLGERRVEYILSDLLANNKDVHALESSKTFVLNILVKQDSFSIEGNNISSWEKQGEIEAIL